MASTTDPKIISDQLYHFVRTHLVTEDVEFDAETTLAELGIDSFALVELLLFSERTIRVTVPESHLTREHLTSLSSMARCIANLACAGS